MRRSQLSLIVGSQLCPSPVNTISSSRRGVAVAARLARAGGEGMLAEDVQPYLAMRRAMGVGMKWSGNLLRAFAVLADGTGQHHLPSVPAIKWAGQTLSVRPRARRL